MSALSAQHPKPLNHSEPVITPERTADEGLQKDHQPPARPVEVGGPEGPEPTRYGDWEKRGRCIDF